MVGLRPRLHAEAAVATTVAFAEDGIEAIATVEDGDAPEHAVAVDRRIVGDQHVVTVPFRLLIPGLEEQVVLVLLALVRRQVGSQELPLPVGHLRVGLRDDRVQVGLLVFGQAGLLDFVPVEGVELLRGIATCGIDGLVPHLHPVGCIHERCVRILLERPITRPLPTPVAP